MELTLQILFGIVAAICLAGGANAMLKGAGYFLPKHTPPQPRLDNIFRFFSGMFFSFGFLLIWMIIHIHELQSIIYFVGMVILFAGLGRLYSRLQAGDAGIHLDRVMLLEILLGLVVMLLQYLR